jgi:hypothetical protein|tara:strand:- start:148 stop:549 length:402 start_codon:yes stop_codon:yes gene_type:complete
MGEFTTLEMIAGALIAFTFIKLVVVAVSVPAWLEFEGKFYERPAITSTVSAVLAGAVLYALVDAGVTITQILAVTVFVVLVMLAGVAPYGKELIQWVEARDTKQWLREMWLYTLIWVALLLWGLYELALKPGG